MAKKLPVGTLVMMHPISDWKRAHIRDHGSLWVVANQPSPYTDCYRLRSLVTGVERNTFREGVEPHRTHTHDKDETTNDC